MRIVRKLGELRSIIRKVKSKGHSIGFVPTMGAFHEGHLSLIHRARRENDFIVVSIFVNPIQFDRVADLRSYPRTLLQDARAARRAGCDLLFAPAAPAMYPKDFKTSVTVEKLSRIWEGRSRPGHFRGVTTVVTKLFHLVEPTVAYLGQKDVQQARITAQLIRDLNFNVRLKILPTLREPGGLAMSSRNELLSSSARRSSRVLFLALQEARRLIECHERRGVVVGRRMKEIVDQIPQARVDYAVVVDPETFEEVKVIRKGVLALIAVWIQGRIRLIDNVKVHP